MTYLYVTVSRCHIKLLQKMIVPNINIPPAGGPYPYVLTTLIFPISLRPRPELKWRAASMTLAAAVLAE
jgi:hypothetical protein